MHAFTPQQREYLACPFRRELPPRSHGDAAVCGLMQEITGFDEDACSVAPDACTACCRSPWPSGDKMGPVVASLIYDTACKLHSAGNSGVSRLRLQELKETAIEYLELVPHESEPQIRPARATRPCCYLGDRLFTSTGTEVYKCHHPAHAETTEERCRSCRDWARNPIAQRTPLCSIVPWPDARVGPGVRSWAVGVTTAPRREPTLGTCVDSLVRAGWPRPHLFVDAAAEIPGHLQPFEKTWRSQRVGAWPNFYLGISELVQAHPDADAYLMLQDDAYLYDAENLREYLEQVLWPGTEPGLVSLFSTDANRAIAPGWSTDPYPWWCGAQAFIFPAEIARRFLLDERIHAYRWTAPSGGKTHIDSLIGEWAAAERIRVWHPMPSLVQHVGNTSTLWNGTGNWAARHAPYFAGDLESPFSEGSTLCDFPESEFPPASEYEDEFFRRVEAGKVAMRKHRAVICGLCRDVRPWLPRTVARIERLGDMFRDYRVVLYENDSHDGTPDFLREWSSRNSRVHVISESIGVPRFEQNRDLARAAHMARCRNRYREYLLEYLPDYDHVIVVDTDLRGGWSYDGVANTFGYDDWDFVGANGILRWLRPTVPATMETSQYDTWALRHVGHAGVHDPAEMSATIFRRGEPLVRVWSCFGGLGIYRMRCFQAAGYSGDDLEHASLHAQMRSGGFGRLFLNPSQLVLY